MSLLYVHPPVHVRTKLNLPFTAAKFRTVHMLAIFNTGPSKNLLNSHERLSSIPIQNIAFLSPMVHQLSM